jgi:hypothetical protein
LEKFTASDGTTFEDRNAWRKYEFETNYTFRDKQAQTLMKVPGQIGGYVRSSIPQRVSKGIIHQHTHIIWM